jgi:DNA-binding GntR family transcriptional regulator
MEERALQLAAPFSRELADELSQRTRSMASALEACDPERYIDEALEYHRRLIEASGNRTFLAVWDFLHWKVRGRVVLRRIARQDGRGLKPFLDLHRALSARIRAGDVQGATEKVRAIVQRATDALGTP